MLIHFGWCYCFWSKPTFVNRRHALWLINLFGGNSPRVPNVWWVDTIIKIHTISSGNILNDNIHLSAYLSICLSAYLPIHLCELKVFVCVCVCLCVLFLFFPFIFISWKLIRLQYCSVFCHTLTWISHGFTCVPHPDPPSHLPLHPIPLGLRSAPALSTCLMWTQSS